MKKLNKVLLLTFIGLVFGSSLFGRTRAANDQTRITDHVASNTADIAAIETVATPSRAIVYGVAGSGQESTTLESGGYVQFLRNASTTPVLKVNNNDSTVYIHNLTVQGESTILDTATITTDAVVIEANVLGGVALDIEPASGGPFTANIVEIRNTAGTTTIALKIDADGYINDQKIDDRVRSADLSFWKKDTCAAGDVFGWFKCPEAMTITKINASVVTAPTNASLEFALNIRIVGGSLASVTSAVIPITTTNTESAEITSFTDATWPKGSIIQIVITQVGSTVAGSNLIVSIEGTYDN